MNRIGSDNVVGDAGEPAQLDVPQTVWLVSADTVNSIMKYLVLAVISGLLLYSTIANVNPADVERPNIVVIVVDDQRWDEFSAAGHPFLNTPNIDRLAAEGAMFLSAFTVSPLCSPNRASLLTGQYISRHGIVDNVARDLASHQLELFPIALQEAGYETAHIGKWHMGNDPTQRPGYDHWISFPGQGRSINPVIYENGQSHEIEGYMTDILTSRALDFIRHDREQPFFLYIGHKAVHPEVIQRDDGSVDTDYGARFMPAERHRGTYAEEFYPRRPNANLANIDLDTRPALQEFLVKKSDEDLQATMGALLDPDTDEGTIRDRSEMLLAVDESLGTIMEELRQQNILDNTLIVFTSDNGYFYGEHGLSVERRMAYEEGIRVPLLMRYPALITPGSQPTQFALSIDIAPTLLDIANATIGPGIQGRSLTTVLNDNENNWRDKFLVEYTSFEQPMTWLINSSYKAIRTEQFKYIHWIHHDGADELYDLEADPYELVNLVNHPDYQEIGQALREDLGELIAEANGL